MTKARKIALQRIAAVLGVLVLAYLLVAHTVVMLLAILTASNVTIMVLLLIACGRLKGIDVHRWWTDFWILAVSQSKKKRGMYYGD